MPAGDSVAISDGCNTQKEALESARYESGSVPSPMQCRNPGNHLISYIVQIKVSG